MIQKKKKSSSFPKACSSNRPNKPRCQETASVGRGEPRGPLPGALPTPDGPPFLGLQAGPRRRGGPTLGTRTVLGARALYLHLHSWWIWRASETQGGLSCLPEGGGRPAGWRREILPSGPALFPAHHVTLHFLRPGFRPLQVVEGMKQAVGLVC